VIILTLAVAVVLAMVTLVLPEFAAIYKTFNTPLPLLTQMVMGLAVFIQEWAIILATLMLIPPVVIYRLRRHARWQRVSQRIVLNLPVMGHWPGAKTGADLYRAVTHAAGWYRLFTRSGKRGRDVENPFWRDVIQGMREKIEQGMPVWSAFHHAAVFTPSVFN
jgi:protein transport protein HofC